jgi:antitoxin component YwqK of YwqJK toxin-antitoxin module
LAAALALAATAFPCLAEPAPLANVAPAASEGKTAESGEPDRTETISSSKGAKELIYRRNVLLEEISYDAAGAIVEERIFGPDSLPVETRTYVRLSGGNAKIARIEAKDGAGRPIGSRTYRYDSDGRLLGVSSEGSLGSGSAGMIANQGIPQGAWVSAPGPQVPASQASGSAPPSTTTILGYDEAGRIAMIETMKDGTSVAIEKRSYSSAGTLLSKSTEDTATGLLSELSYNEKGLLSVRIDTAATGLQQRYEYAYEDSGRLAEELSFKAGHRSARTLSYFADGKLAREEYRLDGTMLRAIAYDDESKDTRVEELYDEGAVFVKSSYVGGRKTRDEFYADGVLVRARDY